MVNAERTRIVDLQNVSRTFRDGERTREVLKDVNLSVDSGELVALVGASGCGKTTLLNIIGALDGDFSGEASFLGRSLRQLDDDARTALRNRNIGFVFQAFHLLEHLSLLQNVMVPLWLLEERRDTAEEEKRARDALALVGLADRAAGSVRPLSGGERQRVALARAVVNRPTLLLADEPTGNLDRDTGRSILELFDRIKQGDGVEGGCAVLVATHDSELARTADRTLRITAGRIEAG